MIKKAILLVCVPVLVLGLAAVADWHPEDGHKMHWPQLPDETGWAVNATQPLILADDFMCTETGWIKDVHFWGAWRHGDEGLVQQFVLSLHADIPADQNPDGYSKPGETLREWEISDWTAVPIDPPTMEGWYDPMTGDVFPDDHTAYFQYNVFLPEADWFPQDSGTIYWLNISAIVQDPLYTQWGWKSTQDNWNDDAVWAEWGDLSWEEMYEPSAPILDGFNIVIDPFGQFVSGGSATAWGLGWYFYPDTEWWNIWFYDHPFDSMRTKEMNLIVDVMKMDPSQPSYVEIALNWSTPWYDTIPNDSTPPLPGVPEDSAIGRIILFGGPDLEGHFEEFFVLPDFNPEWVSVDVRGYNFEVFGEIQHECIGSLDLAFVITGGADEPDTCDYYKSRYLDYVPQGMPDFDMKQPGWTDLNGKWSHDGPAALANCIWWFDSKFEPNPIDPRPFWPGPGNPALNDNYPLLSTYDPALQWDDHDTNNVQPFINDLANNYLNTNPGGIGGTRDMDLITGFRAYLNALGMAPDYSDTIVPVPSFEYIQGEVLVSQDVILLFGFYEEDAAGDWTNYLGSHWVTTAGVCTYQRQICISDPYLDALEGEPPAGSAHGPTVHNDADNISGPHSQIQHDPYNCVSMTPPGWTGPVEVVNYPTTAGIINQFNGMNASVDWGFWGGNPVHVIIEEAYVICPDTAIDTCDYYKSPYDDYVPYGMPDFDQKQDMWIYPASGAWSYCGPVALANCFWWFDSKFEPSPVIPTPFYPGPGNPAANDGYNLVYSFDPGGLWDDHDTNNVMPFVDSMALYCQTNSTGSGTNVFDLAQGAQDWIDSVGLSGQYTVRTFAIDPEFGFDQIRDEVLISQDVILLLGFWEDFGSGSCERIGGHFVTVAGTCTDPLDSALCISDPYFDMHEGEPPAGSAHGSSVHNDAANISGPHGTIHHDKYVVAPTTCNAVIPPFFTCELPGYPVNAGNVPVWYGQNNPDPSIDPIPPQGGPIRTIIEYAVIICPDTTPEPTGACCEPPYGLCHIMTQFSCDSAGWDYKGDGTTCTPDPCDSCDYQTPGDVDNNGVINISDLTYLVNYLYLGGPVPPVMANADVNGDCCLDYLDVKYLIAYLYISGPAPVVCTCVNPPLCLPTPPDHTPGLVRHNTDGYTIGDPTGTAWHELWLDYCERWTLASWTDDGDGTLSYGDTVYFVHSLHGFSSLEHVELVTTTLTLIDNYTADTIYIDRIDTVSITQNPIGTFWHEVYPTYCNKYVWVMTSYFMSPTITVGDNMIIQELPSGAVKSCTIVAVDVDIVTRPVPTLGDEYDHNLDPDYTGGDPVGTNWLELNPNYGDHWICEEFRPNATDWLDYCDTLKFVSETMADSVLWKHVLAATWTMKLFDGTDTLYMDYIMYSPLYNFTSEPEGTWWHEIYPTLCLEAQIVGWNDNGTGYLDFCDWVDIEFINGPDSGNVVNCHVEAFQVDIVTEIIPDPSSCCMPPIRGNVDMDPLDQIDISDLVYLVDYMFTGGPAPVCTEEADMNCSGGSTPIDIADLVYLVDYMFNQGPVPCRCDCSDCP